MDPAPSTPLPQRQRPAHFPPVESHNRSTLIFVTVCTRDRAPHLAIDLVHRALLSAWRQAAHWQVGRYVIMPDHVHFFCSPELHPPTPLPRWIAYWKRLTTQLLRLEGPRPRGPHSSATSTPPSFHWQRDFWDTQLRSGDSYTEKWHYVRNNPVRRGLAPSADLWPFQGELHHLRWHD